MQIRYVDCVVVRDAMMKIPKRVPAWELDMLEAVYGKGRIEDVTEVIVENAPEPLSPEDELQRLAKLYGREKRDDGSAGDSWTALAYGRGRDALDRIESAIRSAIVDLPAPGRRGRKPADKPADADAGQADGE